MCIQDNPRYIKLVEMGMPSCAEFGYSYWGAQKLHEVVVGRIGGWWVFQSTDKPEDAFDYAFSALERYYASHQ